MSVLHLIAISGHAVFGHAVYCHAISGHATIGRAFFVMPSLIKIFVNCNFQWFSIHNKLLCLHIRQIVVLKHSSHVVHKHPMYCIVIYQSQIVIYVNFLVTASITCRAYASITRRVVTVCSIWSCPNDHAVSGNYL